MYHIKKKSIFVLDFTRERTSTLIDVVEHAHSIDIAENTMQLPSMSKAYSRYETGEKESYQYR